MTAQSPSIGELARRLADSQRAKSVHAQGRTLVNESLRLAITKFAGAEGFSSLLRRALALSSTAIPALKDSWVTSDGAIKLTERISALDDVLWQETAVTVTTRLLELLVTFIGEPLTWRLAREACPEVFADE